jgi:hypothetical protein
MEAHNALMPAACKLYVFDGGGEVSVDDQCDHGLCDRSVYTHIACNDLVGDVCTQEVVHDGVLIDCSEHVIGLPLVLPEALYSTSDFKHIQFCSVTNCTSCVTIRSTLLSSLHTALGFLPASPLPLPAPLPVPSPHISSPPPLVVSSLSSYISIQQYYSGSPNFYF